MAGSIAKAYVQVLPSAEGLKGKLSGVLGSEMPSAGASAGSSFATNLIGKIKTVVVAAGIGKILSDAISAGADMEQNVGGIETLFKDSADAVIKNAELAYKTAGLSANQYMETVTSFSASLLQGLGGDTAKAAEIADMAMIDMSDNANKMGTDMTAIQNAYQGFAKQNYTMLDNLKLGYGGTKTEMQRLLADAQKLTGVEYDIDNLSDVYSAIHVIQEELEITETTANEASTTLTGSLSSMKAAFSNVLANLALGKDIGPSLNELGNTVFTFAKDNLLPMVGNIMSALPGVLQETLSMAIRGLNLIGNDAGHIVQMGIDFVIGIGSSIVKALPYLAESAVKIVMAIGSTIINTDWMKLGADVLEELRSALDLAAGEIFGTDGNIVQSLLDAIATEFPNIFSTGAEIISNINDGIFSVLPEVVRTGLEMVMTFAEKIMESLPTVLRAGEKVSFSLVAGLQQMLPDVVDIVLKVLSTFTVMILENLPEMLNSGRIILLNLVEGIQQVLPKVLESAGDAVAVLLTGLIENLPAIVIAAQDLVFALAQGIDNTLPAIGTAIGNVCLKIVYKLAEIDWINVGKDIMRGLIRGIEQMTATLINQMKNVALSALNTVKSAFGIASPSKVMRDEIGRFIPAGVAIGIKQNMTTVSDAMYDMADFTTDSFNDRLRLDVSTAPPATENRYGDIKIDINVYGAEGQDEDVLAERVAERLLLEVERREALFA